MGHTLDHKECRKIMMDFFKINAKLWLFIIFKYFEKKIWNNFIIIYFYLNILKKKYIWNDIFKFIKILLFNYNNLTHKLIYYIN